MFANSNHISEQHCFVVEVMPMENLVKIAASGNLVIDAKHGSWWKFLMINHMKFECTFGEIWVLA